MPNQRDEVFIVFWKTLVDCHSKADSAGSDWTRPVAPARKQDCLRVCRVKHKYKKNQPTRGWLVISPNCGSGKTGAEAPEGAERDQAETGKERILVRLRDVNETHGMEA